MTSADREIDRLEALGSLDSLDEHAAEVVLPTFVVWARFRETAGSGEQAGQQVRDRVLAAGGLFDDVRVEPADPDGAWPVDLRFVVVSVDSNTAVAGVHSDLSEGGAAAYEVWAEPTPLAGSSLSE